MCESKGVRGNFFMLMHTDLQQNKAAIGNFAALLSLLAAAEQQKSGEDMRGQ